MADLEQVGLDYIQRDLQHHKFRPFKIVKDEIVGR
jgi:hypothetical protein